MVVKCKNYFKPSVWEVGRMFGSTVLLYLPAACTTTVATESIHGSTSR